MTRINLLPWREQRRKEQDRQLISIGLGAAVMMVLILVYAFLHVTALIDEQNRRNGFLKEQIAAVDKEIAEIKEIEKKRAALVARIQVIQKLQEDRAQIVHMFDDLARRLPEGVYLSTLKQQGQSFTLTGTAQSNARVSDFMRKLDASEWFSVPDLDIINVKPQGSDRISEFSLRVKAEVKTPAPEADAKPAPKS